MENEENKKLDDINWREKLLAIPLVVMIFWIGIYPQTFLSKIEPTVQHLIGRVAPENRNTEIRPAETPKHISQQNNETSEGGFEWVTTGE